MQKNILKIIYCIWILCSSQIFYAQEIIGGNPSFAPDPYQIKEIDIVKQNIYYEYTFVKNPESKSNTKSALTTLQVGENFSKFVDFYTLKLDSLREKHSLLNRVEINEAKEQFAIRREIGYKETIIKDIKNDQFLFYTNSIPGNNYEYETLAPQLKWKLEPEQKDILGYKVQKATVFYSGRNWTAWFAEAIPIPLGPYTFGDLPGLILELYDDNRHHYFVATGMDTNSLVLYKRNEKNIIKTSKKDFLRTEKSFHDRPDLFFKEAVNGIDNYPKIPYNPIELDY